MHHEQIEDEVMMSVFEQHWQRGVQARREIAKLGHRNMIKFITAITRGYERYAMFEWADGGNLREFWNNHDPHLTRSMVKDVVYQIYGLADALQEIHRVNVRHGDLNPENILRVKTLEQQSDSSKLDVGTLKICDMGFPRYDVMANRFRDPETST